MIDRVQKSKKQVLWGLLLAGKHTPHVKEAAITLRDQLLSSMGRQVQNASITTLSREAKTLDNKCKTSLFYNNLQIQTKHFVYSIEPSGLQHPGIICYEWIQSHQNPHVDGRWSHCFGKLNYREKINLDL